MNRVFTALIGCTMILSLQACHEKGTFEKAGERTDEIADNIKEGEPPLKRKGTAEKVGESIDEAVKKHSDND